MSHVRSLTVGNVASQIKEPAFLSVFCYLICVVYFVRQGHYTTLG